MLLEPTQLLVFMGATLLLNITPGSDVLYIASQSLHSKKHGFFATLGCSTGIAIYIILTITGLAQIMRYSPLAFNVVKFSGIIYFLYLAYQAFFGTTEKLKLSQYLLMTVWSSYYKGTLTNLFNPKVCLFFLTFLPQFINPNNGHAGLQLLILGILFIISGTIVNIIYVFLFSYFGKKMLSHLGFRVWLNKITGVVFCLLVLKLITVHQN